jgi:hypothetical protein
MAGSGRNQLNFLARIEAQRITPALPPVQRCANEVVRGETRDFARFKSLR